MVFFESLYVLKMCDISCIYIAKSGYLSFLCAYFFLQRLYVLIFEQKRLYVLIKKLNVKAEKDFWAHKIGKMCFKVNYVLFHVLKFRNLAAEAFDLLIFFFKSLMCYVLNFYKLKPLCAYVPICACNKSSRCAY